MAPTTLPAIAAVSSLSATERAGILDLLFESCTQLHTLSLDLMRTSSFTDFDDLISSIGMQLTELSESSSASDTRWLESILGAHPRLGEKRVDSEQSRAEQAQLKSGDTDEAAKLTALNEEYEKKFPGLRFVVFVNARSRAVIMENMRTRINRDDMKLERAEAIKAMCDIASDRAKKLQPTT